ncbi:hypothetical protein ILUMI_24263 [Ignelater luminosus]|uniref:Uncharacterized protein n=1 Tax=Ignelater luminosus TaxID=2038154 RepID=A0A8K0CDS0_IGNLU|nr:hypothetical protein ILUMI_24263 [Ignelater luminosus]
MLRNKLLITILVIVAALLVPTLSHCSKGCNCSETSVAVCDSLNFDSFGEHIKILNIAHPKVPLILKGQPFNVTGLHHVNSISINNATILEIAKTAFTGISFLSTFHVVNSNIPTIDDPLAFASATNLTIVSITNSTLSTFENVKSTSLKELNLSGCKLKAVTKTNFINLPRLTYLNLANNNISKIDELAFSTLLDLEVLILSDNNISNLHPDTFKDNTELVTLDLTNNPLKTFDINIHSELEKLVLKSLKLDYFSEKLSKELNLLSYLDLSNNRINFSKNAFEKMEDLEYVDLSNNELTSLDSKIFSSNCRLQKVILDNNNFTAMPKLICNYESFETYFLSCKNCSLRLLPADSFKHLPAVIILNLSNNQLNGINLTAIQYLPSLIELDLSYNNITILNPLSFMKSTALSKLVLTGNPISTLDANLFHNNRVLKVLDLTFCKLQLLWKQPVKGKISSLVQLNIANNSITSITPADLQVTPSLQVLDVSNNPLQCDLNLRDAITWLSEHEVSPASALPTWKTHEPISTLLTGKFVYPNNRASSWRDLARQRCDDEHIFDIEEKQEDKDEEEEEINMIPSKKENEDMLTDDDYDVYAYFDSEEDSAHLDNSDNKMKNNTIKRLLDEAEIDISELALESTHFRKETRSRYSFLWPTLVFIFTALSVLVIAANIMLLLLRARMLPRHVNLPHIKIPQWSTNGKLKKHSGSVYQPLSEDKSEPFTPIVTRKQHVPIHSNSPKSVV